MVNTCEVISWQEALPRLKSVNSEFARLISGLELNANNTFIKITYGYGDKIYKGGILYVPVQGKLWPITSSVVPRNIRDALSYHRIPLGITINKTLEGYLNSTKGLIIPHSIYNSGDLIGTISNLSKDKYNWCSPYWNLTAGNRSLYLLPKITSERGYSRLKKTYGLTMQKPRLLGEQHIVYKCMNRRNSDEPIWRAEIFFLTKDWFKSTMRAYMDFILYLYKLAWKMTENLRLNQYFYYEISNVLNDCYLKPNPYVIDILLYLHGISVGQHAGFFISQTDKSGPVKFLQNALTEVYKLKHAPIFIEANIYKNPKEVSAYFSFALQTLVRYTPRSRNSSRIVDLLELADLVNRVKRYKDYTPNITHDIIEQWLLKTNFQYFHVDTININNDIIQPSERLINYDSAFVEYRQQYPHLDLPTTSSFFRGLIKISTY